MTQQQDIPVRTLPLFPELDRLLVELLRALTPDEWNRNTIARLWTVKDIAAHLLDGTLRNLSASRDHYTGEPPGDISSYNDLVTFINRLNHDWTQAAQRLSPRVLTDLLEWTGAAYTAHLETLDPFAPAIYAVAWAGQQVSPNWFHIAREYTEKFLHQQQIRDTLGRQALFTRELFFPFIDTFLYALPHTYRHVQAPAGTTVQVNITSDIGGTWRILRAAGGWVRTSVAESDPAATVSLDPDTAWKLFSKGLTPASAEAGVQFSGDSVLGRHALSMVSVMA